MADNDLDNIKVTDEMASQAINRVLKNIIDPNYPELTSKILKENASEIKDEIKK